MKRRIQGFVAGAALAIYAAAGAAAFAQPASMPARPIKGGPMMGGPESQAERAARLRDLLQLRSAQEPALQAYVAAIDEAHRGMMSGMDMSQAPPRTTPERLDRMQRMMAQHQSVMAAIGDATRRFYAQLDAGQKRAFDALPMMMLMHGGPGMMGGPGMDGPGMGPGGMDHMRMGPPEGGPPQPR